MRTKYGVKKVEEFCRTPHAVNISLSCTVHQTGAISCNGGGQDPQKEAPATASPQVRTKNKPQKSLKKNKK